MEIKLWEEELPSLGKYWSTWSVWREMTMLHYGYEMNFHPSMMAQAWENGQRLISWHVHPDEKLSAILHGLGMMAELWTLLHWKPLMKDFGRFIAQIGHMSTNAYLVSCAPKWLISLYHWKITTFSWPNLFAFFPLGHNVFIMIS